MLRSIRNTNVGGHRVLLRADLDVPFEKGRVLDNARLWAALPTLQYLVERKAKTLVLGHLGRPHGQIVEELRLRPIAAELGKLGGWDNLQVADDCLGLKIEEAARNLPDGGLLVLENLRFYKGEEENDEAFARQLSSLGDLYINDCFSDSHRRHASVAALPHLLPAYAGFDLEREAAALDKAGRKKGRPLVVIFGGVKKDKLEVLPDFLKKADFILLGSYLSRLLSDVEKAELPDKVIYGQGQDDLDEASLIGFTDILRRARKVIWAGPLGRYEGGFLDGTKRLAEVLLENKCVSIVGGGDTVAALNKLGLAKKMTSTSEAGGAMLHFLAGRRLPGLEALGYYDK